MPIQRPTKTASKFTYRPRTAENLKKRAAQGGAARDSFMAADVNFFSPKTGDNRIRILPPTWENPEHFGYEIYVHYGVGTDENAYLCPDSMKHTRGECPICAERARAEADGEKEYAYELRPTKRISVYLIDRDKPKDGVLVWNMPWTIDRDLCARAVDKMTGEVYNVDDPENGYDISFTRDGQGTTTKYVAIEIGRRSSPLSDDPDQAAAWMDFVIKNPIPKQLLWHDKEHMALMFSGAAPQQEEEGDDKPSRPVGKATPKETPSDEITPEDVMKMDEEEVVKLIDAKGIEDKLGDALEGTLTELKEAIIDLLFGPEPTEAEPTPPPPPPAKESLRDRLKRVHGKT